MDEKQLGAKPFLKISGATLDLSLVSNVGLKHTMSYYCTLSHHTQTRNKNLWIIKTFNIYRGFKSLSHTSNFFCVVGAFTQSDFDQEKQQKISVEVSIKPVIYCKLTSMSTVQSVV